VRTANDFGSTANHEAKMAYHCPACSRAILSRRNKLCGFCGEPLPAELLFTPAQIEKIEAAERARALASKLRAEQRAEAAKRIADAADFSGG
jgi:predicted amidophosphoribosyltransferase